MKELIKAAMPAAWTPMARRLYRFVADGVPTFRKSYRHVDDLGALKCRIAYNRFGGYCVPRSSAHRPAAKAVLSGQVYEPETIDFMRSSCGDRDILHAGTFFGDFLPALSAAIAPRSLVWAFEPNRENYRCARVTLELNEATNVRLAHGGLGAQRQRSSVQTADAGGKALGGASRIVRPGNEARWREPVEIFTIDEVIPPERDLGLLQLDVEGYEQEALSGGLATIRRCMPILILESLPGSRLVQGEWFADNILSLGYAQVARLHGNFVYRGPAQHGNRAPSDRVR
jgi:FkbM family methyltransferase